MFVVHRLNLKLQESGVTSIPTGKTNDIHKSIFLPMFQSIIMDEQKEAFDYHNMPRIWLLKRSGVPLEACLTRWGHLYSYG